MGSDDLSTIAGCEAAIESVRIHDWLAGALIVVVAWNLQSESRLESYVMLGIATWLSVGAEVYRGMIRTKLAELRADAATPDGEVSESDGS